jgi:MYXO-CTERM domain-containing protein
VGTVPMGATRKQTFKLDLKNVACGTEIAVKAFTQSEFHHNRSQAAFLLGAQEKITDGFEDDGGWTVNPDGDDTAVGATWERGTPEPSEILHTEVQPGSAHGGAGAWVTGLGAVSTGPRATLVREGKATLQSPFYETKGLQDPLLRFWVSFVGARAGGTGLLPSEQSTLAVEVRSADASGMPGAWTQVDLLSNDIAPSWVQRSVAIPKELLKKARLQIRFVATDGNPEQGGVEAAIDDLAITSNLAACYQTAAPGGGGSAGGGSGTSSSGCGCQLGATPTSSAVLSTLALLALTLLRRRRR